MIIEDRKGNFPGMLKSRKLHIVIISEGKGSGVDSADNPDKIIEYNGEKIIISLD